MTFAESIRRYRAAAGLSQECLGERVGVSGQAVSKWETADSLPDPSLLPDLADALNVSIDALFDHRPAEPEHLYGEIKAWLSSFPEEERTGQLFRIMAASFQSYFHPYFGEDPAPLVPLSEEEKKDPSRAPVTRSYQINRQDGNGVLYDCDTFPFLSLMLEPSEGWASVLCDERIPGWFAPLSDPDVYRCLLTLCAEEPPHTELSVLMKKSGVDPARAEEVGAALAKMGVLTVETVTVNGRERRIASLWNMSMRNMIITLIASVRAAYLRNRGHHRGAQFRDRPLFEKEASE